MERRQSEPSSTPVITRSGVLQVRNSNNNVVLGYVSTVTEEGLYTLDQSLINAAIISTTVLPTTLEASGLRLTIAVRPFTLLFSIILMDFDESK